VTAVDTAVGRTDGAAERDRTDGAAEPGRRDIGALLAPRGVLVIGASTDPDKLGGAMAARLADFPGPVELVNARGAGGMHTNVADAADAVRVAGGFPDLAVLCVPAAACPDLVRECAAHGVGAALVVAGGFAETGEAGAALQEALALAAQETGVRVLGPNTSGFFVPGRGLCASFVPGVDAIREGTVAVVAASGGLNHALAFAFQRGDVGLSLGVGIGAGIDVTAIDVLHHLADDPATTAIALHLETVSDGPGLLAAVRAASARKPVVAMVVGRHDVGEFAASHTGALATSWRTTRALLRQAGAVLVDRADDLVVATSALAKLRLPAGPVGVGLVTAQAGPGLVIADALQGAGVHLPVLTEETQRHLADLLPPMTYQANPVDTGRPGPAHADVILTVAQDPQVDLVAIYGLLEPVVDLPTAAASAAAAGHSVVVGTDGPGTEVGIAHRRTLDLGLASTVGAQALACAVAAMVQDAQGRDQDPATPVSDSPDAEPLGAGPWDEAEAKSVLDRLRITTPERRLCTGRDAAHRALDDFGGPVVVKVCDAAILHKSDVGGVHVGVGTHDRMDAALDALARLGDGPVLVEKMADDGVDLIVGARRDPVFGPVVLLGVGGIATEVYADAAIASVPANREVLRALPDQLRGRALLDGFRGQPAVDRDALADVVAALGSLLAANDHITDIEINPLRSTSRGLVALDAVIVARED
jgi:acetyltransferase